MAKKRYVYECNHCGQDILKPEDGFVIRGEIMDGDGASGHIGPLETDAMKKSSLTGLQALTGPMHDPPATVLVSQIRNLIYETAYHRGCFVKALKLADGVTIAAVERSDFLEAAAVFKRCLMEADYLDKNWIYTVCDAMETIVKMAGLK